MKKWRFNTIFPRMSDKGNLDKFYPNLNLEMLLLGEIYLTTTSTNATIYE